METTKLLWVFFLNGHIGHLTWTIVYLQFNNVSQTMLVVLADERLMRKEARYDLRPDKSLWLKW